MAGQNASSINAAAASTERTGHKQRLNQIRRLRTEANAVMLGAVILLMWVPPLSQFLGLEFMSNDALIADTFERIACTVATWFAVYRIFQYNKEVGRPFSSSIFALETLFAFVLTAIVIYSVLNP
ncbi:MAG TPA: hypothetical protein VEJ63_08305 [Planctomycetota bacterium]|nr:hypothetical protein [Planctomycetota bacterium]